MVISYARVSTHEQNLSLQLDAFQKAKFGRVFQEHISSGSKARPELTAALDVLREGYTFGVWRLDRLGRNMRELDDLVRRFKKQGFALIADRGHRHANREWKTLLPHYRRLCRVRA